MMYRQMVCMVLVVGLWVSFSVAAPATKSKTATDRPYLFCVDNYGAMYVFPESRGAKLELREAPEGMELLPSGGVLLWSPTESQIGEHVVRVGITPQTGPPSEKTFRIRVKPVERVLCVFAHADDEFGVMAKLKRLSDRGVDVWAVWTCGHNKVRNAEATQAMTKVGLEKDHLIFQTCGNHNTAAGLQQKAAPLAKLLRRLPFDQIYVNAYEGGHAQHDMSHFVTVQAARQAGFRGQIYEASLYNLYGGRPRTTKLLPAAMPSIEMELSEAELNFLLLVLPIYDSQKHIMNSFLAVLSKEEKMHPRYRPRPNWDYTRRPHPGLQFFEMKFYQSRPTFAKRIAAPVQAYHKAHGGGTRSVWEQDRTPAEKTLAQKKVVTEPYQARKTEGQKAESQSAGEK